MNRRRGAMLATGLLATVIAWASALALEPPRPGQESFLTSAVYTDNELWVLSDSGVLSSMRQGDAHWTTTPITDPVFLLCANGNRVLALTGKREDDFPAWTLLRRDAGSWTKVTAIDRDQDAPIALQCQGDETMLLTSRRLIDLTSPEPTVVELHGDRPFGRVNVGFGTPQDFYIGANSGEWGGGLHRIDPRTGAVSAVARNVSGKLCGGPLNIECDPVNGITAEPWNPDCVAVAIGLVHMSTHGRVVEVCGDQVRELYSKPLENAGSESAHETVAFFGIVAHKDELWASGIDGLYRIRKGGAAEILPLPEFQSIDGIAVSFDLPHVILVLSSVNQRTSMSGAVPLLVPR